MAAAIAVLAAAMAPAGVRAQTSCAWWDQTCNDLGRTASDYGWHIAGRDANGEVLYVRRRVESNGNVLFEQARRNDYGRYVISNTHSVRNTRTHSAGTDCKYKSNPTGYSEQCKYAKADPANTVKYDKRYEPKAGKMKGDKSKH